MPRVSDIYDYPAGSIAVTNTTISSTAHNNYINDIKADLNLARPILAGGTGATTAPQARTNLGIDTAISTAVEARAVNYDYRNLVINGGMQVQQETPAGGTVTVSAAGTTSGYIADLFGVTCTVTGQSLSYSVPSGFISAGLGHAILMNCGAGGSPGASQQSLLTHIVEGDRCAGLCWGSAVASPITVSFWLNSSVAGVLPVAIRNGAADRSYVTTVTITTANIWQFVSITIPGDTTGTWLKDQNTVGMRISFGVSVGSTFQVSSLNAWTAGNFTGHSTGTNFPAAPGRTLYIGGLSVLPGSILLTATQFPLTLRSFTDDLPLVKRYWQKSWAYPTAPGTATTAGAIMCTGMAYVATATTASGHTCEFPVEMRTTPGVVLLANPDTGTFGQVKAAGPGNVTTGTPTVAASSSKGFLFSVATSGMTPNAPAEVLFHWAANARF